MTASSDPISITTGPDGNLWFAERDGSQIGWISPDGSQLTEIPTPTYSGPDGVTAGPDGNLWFTEFSGNQIGQFINDGMVPAAARTPSPFDRIPQPASAINTRIQLQPIAVGAVFAGSKATWHGMTDGSLTANTDTPFQGFVHHRADLPDWVEPLDPIGTT